MFGRKDHNGYLPLIGLLCMALILSTSCNFPALVQAPLEALSVTVEVPAIVRTGADFQLKVDVANTGNSTILVDEIRLPKGLLNGAVVTGVDPVSTGTNDYSNQVGYVFTLIQAPGTNTTVTFEMKSLQPGDYSGDLSVAMGTQSKDSAVRVVVQTAENAIDQGANISSETIPYRSVVEIVARVSYGGDVYDGWSGSGTIISSDGLILTNAHVVLSEGAYQVEELVICITNASDEPPEPTYLAEVLQADAELDIAVLQVVSFVDGQPIDPGSLNLPAVPIGDSNALQLGDSVTILGYPGIGGETITLTRGEVAGFTAEAGYGNRAFIKTSATIAGGNSGGLAANGIGQIIGVPSEVGYGGEGEVVDCRALADTNRDGVINDRDDCVPIGGYINALRPIALALPLIEAAQQGEVNIQAGTEPAGIEFNPSGDVIFSDDFSSGSSGWDTGSNSEGSVRYQAGQLVIWVFSTYYIIWTNYSNETFADIQITVDTEVLQESGYGEYGIICDYQDGNNFYILSISEDGYFTIYKFVDGDEVDIIGWTPTDLIDLEAPATITATCANGKLSLAYNDILLAEAQDASFGSGLIGLIASTYDVADMTIAFDNLVVRQK
jgi:S1-C subfamily serine protease